jgi:hypothetical protein
MHAGTPQPPRPHHPGHGAAHVQLPAGSTPAAPAATPAQPEGAGLGEHARQQPPPPAPAPAGSNHLPSPLPNLRALDLVRSSQAATTSPAPAPAGSNHLPSPHAQRPRPAAGRVPRECTERACTVLHAAPHPMAARPAAAAAVPQRAAGPGAPARLPARAHGTAAPQPGPLWAQQPASRRHGAAGAHAAGAAGQGLWLLGEGGGGGRGGAPSARAGRGGAGACQGHKQCVAAGSHAAMAPWLLVAAPVCSPACPAPPQLSPHARLPCRATAWPACLA